MGLQFNFLMDNVIYRIDAARSLKRDVVVRFPTLVPGIVASIFAVELYVKCLLRIQNRSIKKMHELTDLFDLVSTTALKRIEELYDVCSQQDASFVALRDANKGNGTDFSMKGTLNSCKRAFQERRYYHEGIPSAEA